MRLYVAFLHCPQISPSIWILRTHSSNFDMSVSSSQGLTSNRIEDLAMRAGSEGEEESVTMETPLNDKHFWFEAAVSQVNKVSIRQSAERWWGLIITKCRPIRKQNPRVLLLNFSGAFNHQSWIRLMESVSISDWLIVLKSATWTVSVNWSILWQSDVTGCDGAC